MGTGKSLTFFAVLPYRNDKACQNILIKKIDERCIKEQYNENCDFVNKAILYRQSPSRCQWSTPSPSHSVGFPMSSSPRCKFSSSKLNTFKGTVAWDGFFAHCILYRIERKYLTFFSCCANICWVRARFNSFSVQGECEQWNFSVRQAKNFNCILFSYGSDIRCHLTWLKYWPFKVLISIVEKSLGALSKVQIR
jgi:hypothetical protein